MGFVWEHGTIPHVMSMFSALEAASFLDAFFSFFFGKFFNVNGVDIHSVWVNFLTLVAGSMVSLYWVWAIGFSVSNGVGSIPLHFEVDSLSVPVINSSRNCVHTVDSFHKWCGNTP